MGKKYIKTCAVVLSMILLATGCTRSDKQTVHHSSSFSSESTSSENEFSSSSDKSETSTSNQQSNSSSVQNSSTNQQSNSNQSSSSKQSTQQSNSNQSSSSKQSTQQTGSLTTELKKNSSWKEGDNYCGTVELTVKNSGATVNSWKVNFNVPNGFKITNSWSADFSVNGTTVNVSGNTSIPQNGSVTAGFNYSCPSEFSPSGGTAVGSTSQNNSSTARR